MPRSGQYSIKILVSVPEQLLEVFEEFIKGKYPSRNSAIVIAMRDLILRDKQQIYSQSIVNQNKNVSAI